MTSARKRTDWSQVIGQLFLSVPVASLINAVTIALSVAATWRHGALRGINWVAFEYDIGPYALGMLIGSAFWVAVVGCPVAAILAVTANRIPFRWLRLSIHFVVGSALGSAIFLVAGPSVYANPIVEGVACGLSAVIGILAGARIHSAIRRRRTINSSPEELNDESQPVAA
jgi:hypothetical protein